MIRVLVESSYIYIDRKVICPICDAKDVYVGTLVDGEEIVGCDSCDATFRAVLEGSNLKLIEED